MEREANYFAVGAFVILLTALVGLFVYWYSEGRDQANYVRFEMYFRGSVTGLSEGGSVRYLGVEVGKVRRVRLDARSADRVMVVADIDSAAPISERTTAELSMMSFATGLLYVDLRQNNGSRELLPPVPSLQYPVINSVRSTLDSFMGFMDSLPDLAASASVLMERAQEIFSPENSRRLADLVKNLHDATQKLPGTMEHIDGLMGELTTTAREVRRLTGSVNSRHCRDDAAGAAADRPAQRHCGQPRAGGRRHQWLRDRESRQHQWVYPGWPAAAAAVAAGSQRCGRGVPRPVQEPEG